MTEQTPWEPGQTNTPPAAQPVRPTAETGPKRRGGIGVGIVLIAMGLVFLAAPWVPGVSWTQLWPMIFVVIGIIMLVTPDQRDGWGLHRVLDGIGTLILGVVLLGNTTGFISWGVWWTMVTLWPVFLISAGIGIVGRAVGQTWLRAVGTLLIWVAFAYAVATAFTGAGGLQPIAPVLSETQGQSFAFSEPAGSARTANLTFDGGAGDIGIASASSGELASAQGSSPFGKPSFSIARSGERADVRIGTGQGRNTFLGPDLSSGRFNVGLSDAVLWNATIDTGASNLTVDLSHVKLSALKLDTGVSSVDLKLGPLADEAPAPSVTLKTGVAAVTITVPKGTPVRVLSNSGLTALTVSGDFKRTAPGVWMTDNKTPGRGYDIQVDSGVGSVSIGTY